MFPIGSGRCLLLNQSTHSKVAYSMASNERQGPRRWITSATVCRFGQSVLVVVADAIDERLDASFSEALSVFDGRVL